MNIEDENKKKMNVFREMCEQIRGILDLGGLWGKEPVRAPHNSENSEESEESENSEGLGVTNPQGLEISEDSESEDSENSEDSAESLDAIYRVPTAADGTASEEGVSTAADETEDAIYRVPTAADGTASEEGVSTAADETEDAIYRIPTGVPEELVPLVEMIARDFAAGEFSEECLSALRRARDYEEDVAKALEAGELKGRNARIEEHLVDSYGTDGLPHPQSRNSNCFSGNVESIFDLARTAM